MTQSDVDVRNSQHKSCRLMVAFGNPGKLRHQQRLQFFGHELDLRFCEWHKTPVLFPRLIVNFTKPSTFIADIVKVRWTDNGGTARIETCGNSSFRRLCLGRDIIPLAVPDVGFCESALANV